MAGGSGLQGKVLLGHKERFFFRKGKVPWFILPKKEPLPFWFFFLQRKCSFSEKERFFFRKGKVPWFIFYKGKVLLVIRKCSFSKKERFFFQKGKVLFQKGKFFPKRKGYFSKKERFLCAEERFLVTKGMFPVLNFGNMMQRMRDGGRVVQSRFRSLAECRGRVFRGER